MSAGAAFSLILKDDRFDRYFTMTSYLQDRINKAKARRKADGEAIIEPTFADIERTHKLYILGGYKPYVALASEYVRVSGSGDGSAAISTAGGTLDFKFPTFGHFTSDMVVHIKFSAIGTQLTNTALIGGPGGAPTPYLRYCALPGVRIFKRVSFKSGSTTIDDYTPEDVLARSKFFIGANHRAGWERCMGQQEQREASFYGNGFTGSMFYRDGPQTPKQYQPSFDIFVPLQFWFCDDMSSALFNEMIPNTQREISCELAPLRDIVQALIPGVSVDPLIPTGMTPTELPFQRLAIRAELYVNGVMVNPEVYDIFASRCTAKLIRVHRRHNLVFSSPQQSFLLNNLKFPLEYLMVGVRSRAIIQDFDRWWMMGSVRARTDETRLLTPAIVWNSTIVPSGMAQLVVRECVDVSSLDNVVDTIGVTAQGIDLMIEAPSTFYNAYMPIRYTKNSLVVSPVDAGSFLVTFSIYPGKFDPSGYYNMSAGRELYLNLNLKVEPREVGGIEAVLTGIMLNLLLYRGDGLALKYSL